MYLLIALHLYRDDTVRMLMTWGGGVVSLLDLKLLSISILEVSPLSRLMCLLCLGYVLFKLVRSASLWSPWVWPTHLGMDIFFDPSALAATQL